MKFTKLSLVAALAMNVAFAGGDIAPVEPVVEAAPVVSESTISGNVKLFYGTNDAGTNKLFSKNGATGDAYADIKYSRKVYDNVTLNLGMAYLSTLGLENDLVSSTWAGHNRQASINLNRLRTVNANPASTAAQKAAALATFNATAGQYVNDAAWMNEANVVIGGLPGSSFLKIGRQELDTPFFYSEKWSIATNTFDAAVAGTNVLPDTTLIAAWVGRGNGAAGTVVALNNTDFGGGHVAFGSDLVTAGALGSAKPAYAFAAINKSISNTALQAWYYKIPSAADAYWLQADTKIGGIELGAQYAGTTIKNTTLTTLGLQKTSAYALRIGYSADALSAYAAYSKRDNKTGIDISNIATGVAGSNGAPTLGGGESRLYTEAYWNYGFVGGQDAKTIAAGVSYDLGMAKLGAQYTNVNTSLAASAGDMQEFAVTASAKVGPINADLAYINAKSNGNPKNNTVLVMLSMPFSL